MSYFAVLGCNGFAVMDESEKAQSVQRYIKLATIESFERLDDAAAWVLAGAVVRFPNRSLPRSLKLNWAYYPYKFYYD